MTAIKDLPEKIEYLAKTDPRTIRPPLSQVGKAFTYGTHEYVPIEKVRSDLQKLPPEEVEKRFQEKKSFERGKVEAAERQRYLNCDADFDYWGKQAYWSIDEGVILVLGKDPRKIKWEMVSRYVNISLFAKKFEEMRDLAQRYVSCGQLTSSISPGSFLAWARRMSYALPENLVEVVEAHGMQIADWQTLYRNAMEVIKQKNLKIEAMSLEYEQLKTKHEDLERNPFQMDENSPDYAEELDAANIIYRTVIMSRDESMTFKEQASALLKERYSHFSEDAIARIAKVINTKRGKHGGRKPSLSE